MIDRGQQALHLLALEPIAETQADKNSYGFRPKRSCHDAIEQCFIALARKYSPKWILEGDIKSCFDQISHTWLENNITMDKRVLRQWLKAGYIEEGFLHSTEKGTPQGGLASPVLCNMVLDGLEKVIKSITKPGEKINFVRYADDWICTAENREILESKVLPKVIEFLKERGLELSQEKTKITHINEGFDFLGFNLRKYKEKFLIKPSKKSVKSFLKRNREIIRTRRAAKQSELIKTLNPKIQGWTNYYRHSVAKRIFNQVDASIFRSLWRWAKRRHPNKSITWIKRKYFPRIGLKNWCFCTKGKGAEEANIFLKSAAKTRIIRHVKIKADATPHDPDFKDYFAHRAIKLRRNKIQPG